MTRKGDARGGAIGAKAVRLVNRRGGHHARARLSHTRLRWGQPPFPSLVKTPSGRIMRPGGIFGTVGPRIGVSIQATGATALKGARHWLDHTHVAVVERLEHNYSVCQTSMDYVTLNHRQL